MSSMKCFIACMAPYDLVVVVAAVVAVFVSRLYGDLQCNNYSLHAACFTDDLKASVRKKKNRKGKRKKQKKRKKQT